MAALTFADSDIISEAQTVAVEWPDKLEGLEWKDGLGQKEGRIWIPESDELWRKILRLYHNSLVTGHLGMLGTWNW